MLYEDKNVYFMSFFPIAFFFLKKPLHLKQEWKGEENCLVVCWYCLLFNLWKSLLPPYDLLQNAYWAFPFSIYHSHNLKFTINWLTYDCRFFFLTRGNYCSRWVSLNNWLVLQGEHITIVILFLAGGSLVVEEVIRLSIFRSIASGKKNATSTLILD